MDEGKIKKGKMHPFIADADDPLLTMQARITELETDLTMANANSEMFSKRWNECRDRLAEIEKDKRLESELSKLISAAIKSAESEAVNRVLNNLQAICPIEADRQFRLGFLACQDLMLKQIDSIKSEFLGREGGEKS